MSSRILLHTLLVPAFLSSLVTVNALAQAPPATSSAQPGTASRQPRQEPCWQVAGISKEAMQQRRTLTQQARQEVEGVCANSSLTAQQKRQQIQQIHQRERQEVEAIITPAQQEALRSCQSARSAGHGSAGHSGAGGGPCGEMPTGGKPNPPNEDDETPPAQSSKPD